MSNKKNIERVKRCRAKQKRIELLFKIEEYSKIVEAANGSTISAYIKEAVKQRMNS